MKFYPKEKTLRNGSVVTLREAGRKDAGALLQTVSRYLAESEHLLTSIEEFNPTIRDERRWIESLNNARNSLLLIAVHDRKIIGNVDLRGEIREKTRHNATLGIGVLNQWQGLGVGSILLDCAIEWAHQSHSLETLWLNVFATNTKAISLYKQKGFEEVAVQKGFIKSVDDYIDNLIMKLDVR